MSVPAPVSTPHVVIPGLVDALLAFTLGEGLANCYSLPISFRTGLPTWSRRIYGNDFFPAFWCSKELVEWVAEDSSLCPGINECSQRDKIPVPFLKLRLKLDNLLLRRNIRLLHHYPFAHSVECCLAGLLVLPSDNSSTIRS